MARRAQQLCAGLAPIIDTINVKFPYPAAPADRIGLASALPIGYIQIDLGGIVKLKELAASLGLSPTTVSRALAGYPEVSESTRARVRAAAATAGYQPDRAALRLKTGRADAIGIVLPTGPQSFGDPFFAELLAGMGERAAEAGLDMLVTAAPAGADELSDYRRLVETRRVDGMVVARTLRRDPRLGYLLDQGVPFVAHGRTEDPRPYAYLDIDGEGALRLAARRVIGLGHRRLALIAAPSRYMFAAHRQAGFRAALAEAGLDPDAAPVLEGDLTEASGHRHGRALLTGSAPPSAILCMTDRMAAGVMLAARELGLAVGRDLSVIGYGDLPLSAVTDPPLTTVYRSIAGTGRRVVELLLRRLAGAPVQDLQELWTPELVVRGSDGPWRGGPIITNPAITNQTSSGGNHGTLADAG